ncbi:MAG: VC0807 family protein, partial [Terriglobales bacterium]
MASVAGAVAATAEAPAVLAGILRSMVLNAVVPVTLYVVSQRYISPSEYTALVLATLFPVGVSLWELLRQRQVDPIAAVVLLGIVTDAAALSLGGSAKLLLIRESFATGAIGAACFVSLLLPRPLMF